MNSTKNTSSGEIDWLSLIERRWDKYTQTSIFDWNWIYIKWRDELLYNIDWFGIDSQERLEKLIKQAQPRIADLLLWTDFKKPAKNLNRITDIEDIECFDEPSEKAIDLWYYDNTFVFNTQDILEELWINSLALWWAVADCAWICGSYNNWEIISISHVWWQWTVNWVIEQLVYTYMAELWRKEFSKVQFDLSPMAWVNYEWDKNNFWEIISEWKELKTLINHLKEYISELEKLKNITQLRKNNEEIRNIDIRLTQAKKNLKEAQDGLKDIYKQTLFLDIAEEYNIDFIKDKIVEESKNPKKVIFFLDRLIKRIFLENWARLEQLHFHSSYTTDFDNSWPSYRTHSLWKRWVITTPMTKKSINWIVPDARMGVFNVVSKK